MRKRKFVFFEPVAHSTSTVKGHVQLDGIDNRINLKIFFEGLNRESYNVCIVDVDGEVHTLGTFRGSKKLSVSYDFNINISKVGAIVIWEDKKKIDTYAAIITNDLKIDYKKIKYGNNIDVERENQLKSERHNVEVEMTQELERGKSTPVEQLVESHDSKNQEAKGEKENLVENEKSEDESEKETQEFDAGVYNNSIYYLWENVDKLDQLLERAEPFKQQIPKHKWWKVREYDNQIQYLCILYNGYLMPMVYPFMNYKNIYANNNDWIFGTVTEDFGEKKMLKYFVYGIPGRFYVQEQPFKGSTGYLYWQSVDVLKDDPNGYWLLYVDVHTGKIVIPRRPVRPPLNRDIMPKSD